ncbi:hypothetical protein CspeluHIS016_0108560 [Cutaneotrichosporon spelunceum]|uniref:Uncharacterized protein n=1 Tax=Cutaneotrichosporon spelunceum TaxID=1672016 RepID=A0AAD3TP51_9TREE|nr:hypothetical protein CspeluHIS016_0108560 [Cutaneotrichosporon spelunceum]
MTTKYANSPVSSASASAGPFFTYTAADDTRELRSLVHTLRSYATRPLSSTASSDSLPDLSSYAARPLSSTASSDSLWALSTTSTDSAYSHLSYDADSHCASWPNSVLAFATDISDSSEEMDIEDREVAHLNGSEEAYFIHPEEAYFIDTEGAYFVYTGDALVDADDVPTLTGDVPTLAETEDAHTPFLDEVTSLAELDTMEDLDLDADDSGIDYGMCDAAVWAGWAHYPDDDWECLYARPHLLPPPPSPARMPKRANILPLLSLPQSTLATLLLLALVHPASSADLPDTDPVQSTPCLPHPVWLRRKLCTVLVHLLALGIVLCLAYTRLGTSQAVPMETITGDLFIPPPRAWTEGAIILETAQAMSISGTRGTSARIHTRTGELGDVTNFSSDCEVFRATFLPPAARVGSGALLHV